MQNNTHPIHGHPIFQFQEDRIDSEDALQASLIYQTDDGMLRWAAAFPLPEIDDRIQPKLTRIGTVEVTGYYRDGDQIGIIAVAESVLPWLDEENERDRASSNIALYRNGGMRNKLCLFGNEIEPVTKNHHVRKNEYLSQRRTEPVAL